MGLQLPFMQESVVVNADISGLTSSFIFEASGLKRGEIDLLAGGPPCQAFSVFGKRLGRKDKRGQLVEQYYRLLGELRPKAFLFENVFGLLTVERANVLQTLDQGFVTSFLFCVWKQHTMECHSIETECSSWVPWKA